MRGAPTSVPMGALLRAAAERFAQGFREIVLTGCNLALYRDPDTGAALPELLARLCDVPGEGRFRLGSLEPCVTDDAALFRLAAGSGGRLCAFFHLPIQSGSDALLARMGRPYGAARIRATLDALCVALPFCGLGADWIAGLPGETEADTEATKRKMRAILRACFHGGNDAIVLGAFGCGAFRNPPAHIARLFREVFEEPEFRGVFRRLTFAILDDHNAHHSHNPEGNLLPFQRVFG